MIIGPDGNVKAGSLTLLKKRPQGIREVTNPLPATGGSAPDTLEQARDDAPLTALLLNRVVSLKDFEDFARTFPGIGTAQAAFLWNGQTYLLHITIASDDGKPIAPHSALLTSLVKAIDRARAPTQRARGRCEPSAPIPRRRSTSNSSARGTPARHAPRMHACLVRIP